MRYLFFICLLIGNLVNAQPYMKSMLRLPDTGLNSGYTNTFGEDNDYKIFTPYFIKNGDGTATDTITTLMWQQTDGGEMTYENAKVYCDTLTLGGYTDWRLPTAQESFSILNHQYTNPATDGNVFTKTTAEYWWTSEIQLNSPSKVWCTNAGGGIGNHPKAETISAGGNKKFHVRAVRDTKALGSFNMRFTDNGDSTITDELTELMWQQLPSSTVYTWEQALTYAEGLNLANHADWRLPNIKELQSLNDETKMSPSIDNTFFTNIEIAHYWSSTTLPNQTSKAWYLETGFGITTYELKTNTAKVLCVRNKTNANLGMMALSVNPVSIYPNPCHDKITVDVNRYNHLKSSIHIYNLAGEIVYEQELFCNETTVVIDVNTIPSGLYLLSISNKEGEQFSKLIIMHEGSWK